MFKKCLIIKKNLVYFEIYILYTEKAQIHSTTLFNLSNYCAILTGCDLLSIQEQMHRRYFLLFYYVKQTDFMPLCVCQLIDTEDIKIW